MLDAEEAFADVLAIIQPVHFDGMTSSTRATAETILESFLYAVAIGIVFLGDDDIARQPVHFTSDVLLDNLQFWRKDDQQEQMSVMYTLFHFLLDGVEQLLTFVRLNDPCVVQFLSRQGTLTPEEIVNGRFGTDPHRNPDDHRLFSKLIGDLKTAATNDDVVAIVGSFLKQQKYHEREYANEGCAKRSQLGCMGGSGR